MHIQVSTRAQRLFVFPFLAFFVIFAGMLGGTPMSLEVITMTSAPVAPINAFWQEKWSTQSHTMLCLNWQVCFSEIFSRFKTPAKGVLVGRRDLVNQKELFFLGVICSFCLVKNKRDMHAVRSFPSTTTNGITVKTWQNSAQWETRHSLHHWSWQSNWTGCSFIQCETALSNIPAVKVRSCRKDSHTSLPRNLKAWWKNFFARFGRGAHVCQNLRRFEEKERRAIFPSRRW